MASTPALIITPVAAHAARRHYAGGLVIGHADACLATAAWRGRLSAYAADYGAA